MTADETDLLALRRDTTLSTLVAGRLETFILSGQLQVGERINEVVLARELGVSRGPIREAARLLASQGLVEFVPNKGAYVREITRDELLEIYMLRSLLTGMACELATRRGGGAEALETLHIQMSEAVAANDSVGYYKLNLEFHARLVEMSGSPRLRTMIEGLVKEQHLFRRASLTRTNDMEESNREHRAILDAMARGDAEAARRLGEAHVRRGRERFEAASRNLAQDQ
ncbi:MAG: FCD domain-containing protein [Devosia sp.]|uniref:GntR family transcriptional regulator n=1 Tax=Devosia sp. TaxID=1871048 RepID=UPI001A572FBD|nr:FCD domain-containing protein [Devosia sp.]MBL8600006.1 FCD domain-containing protein [Devosia sp.]